MALSSFALGGGYKPPRIPRPVNISTRGTAGFPNPGSLLPGAGGTTTNITTHGTAGYPDPGSLLPGAGAGGNGTTGGAPGAGGGVTNPYDLGQDPGYLRALSQAYGMRGQAASNYLSQVEQSLLGYGSLSLAQKVLAGMQPELEGYMHQAGSLADGQHLDLNPFYQSFYLHDANGNQIKDANGNPLMVDDRNQGFSTLAQLGRAGWGASQNTINQNRLANLMYSSAGAQALQNTGYNNQLALNNSAAQENALLGQYLNSYQGGLASALDTENQGAQSAYDRLVQQALANHTGADGAGGGGGAGGAAPPPGGAVTTTQNPNGSTTTNISTRGTGAFPNPSSLLGSGYAPFAQSVTANRTGASANRRQGIFSIH